MNKIYLYPKVLNSENPYIMNLENSLSQQFDVVNKESNRNGVLDLFKFLFKADIYYFNWIENLASRRLGNIQIIVFILFLLIAKCLRKRIVWTLHNKYSHDKNSSKWTDLMFYLMFRYSGFIVTHSQSGVDFAKEKYPLYSDKVKYLIHPVKPVSLPAIKKDPVYNFFIWGTIWPYKGINEFLNFLNESGNSHLKVLIAGICISDQVKIELGKYLSSNIVYLDHFFNIEDIALLSKDAEFTVFTYRPESVLSSGSLMDSIAMGSVIIGPNVGAFKDLSSYKFIKTYNTFNDIITINNNYQPDRDSLTGDIDAFCKENTWDLFGKKLCGMLNEKLKLKKHN